MQELNKRRSNCRRSVVKTESLAECTQKQQRIRCCGRVVSQEELSVNLPEDAPRQRLLNGQSKGMKDVQRRGQCKGRRQWQQSAQN